MYWRWLPNMWPPVRSTNWHSGTLSSSSWWTRRTKSQILSLWDAMEEAPKNRQESMFCLPPGWCWGDHPLPSTSYLHLCNVKDSVAMTSTFSSGMKALGFCDRSHPRMYPGTVSQWGLGYPELIPQGSIPTIWVFKGQGDEFTGHHEHENHPKACGQQKPLVVHVVKSQPFSDFPGKHKENAPAAYKCTS